MRRLFISTAFFLAAFSMKAQDLVSGGSNSWIFHTPDSPGGTTLHIAPKKNGSWDWGSQLEILNDGSFGRFFVARNGARIQGTIHLQNDLIFDGGNDWIIHTPGSSVGNMHFAPKINGQWNWGKQIYFTKEANLIVDGSIGIGTRNPDSKLTVKGKIHAEEIKVDLNVPADYVFQKYYTGASSLKEGYKLPTLEEVEAFTKKNHHLPEVPSAKEFQKKGLHLKQMTNLLLQKIEELTLYTIEQEKKLKKQETKIKEQSKKNLSLEKRLSKLESLLQELTQK